MSIFKNLNSDGLEESEDRLGGGTPALDTDVYTMKITMAYAGQSAGGARNVTVQGKIKDGPDYSETIYITNKKGENYFLNKEDKTKKVPLPGFTTIDDLCLVATGESLENQPTEEKLVKQWDYEEKKELPKAAHVLVDLIGKEVGVAIVKSTVDVSKKDDAGNYIPTGKTRDENTIEKVYDLDSKLTVAEARKGLETGVFIDAWAERNKGQTRDKTAKNDNQAGKSGRPGSGAAPQAGAKTETKRLFGNKNAA